MGMLESEPRCSGSYPVPLWQRDVGGAGWGGLWGLDPGLGALCPAAERKEIQTGTKCISVKAARWHSQALGAKGRRLLAPAMERNSLSLHSLSEAEDMRSPGLLACKRPPSPTLQHAASEDNLSSSTGEAPSREVRHHGDGPGPWLQGQKKSLGKKQESLEAKRRKRRSRSFEVTGQGVRRGAEGRVSEPLRCRWGPEGWIPPEAPGPLIVPPDVPLSPRQAQ